jgi:flavin-binding protein dodecin
MAAKVYKMIDLVGASEKSIEDAINVALGRASKTMRNLDWFEVKELRGSISKGKANQYQVKLQVGFRLEDEQ